MNEEVFRIQNLFIQNDDRQKISNLNLALSKGETLGIFGLHNSGKDTLFDAVTGKTAFQKGIIYYRDNPYYDSKTAGKSVKITRISTTPSLFGSLTLWENILVLRKRKRFRLLLNRRFIKKEVEDQFHYFGLAFSPNQLARNLTSFQCFIMELMRAFFTSAEIVLIDDFSLDLNQKEEDLLSSLINKLKKEGMSFVLFSRRISILKTFSDRIAFLLSGAIVKTIINAEHEGKWIDSVLSSIYTDEKGQIQKTHPEGETVFEGRNLNLGLGRKIDISLRKGEVTAIIDPFQTDASRFEQNLQENLTAGRFSYKRSVIKKSSWRNKIIYTDFDAGRNIFSGLSLADNLCFPILRRFSTLAVFRTRLRDYAVSEFRNWAGNDTANRIHNNSDLTQKEKTAIHLFRIKLANPEVLICRDPRTGTDYSSVKMIYRELMELSHNLETAVLIILSSLNDLENFADRYLVITRNNDLREVGFDELRKTAFSDAGDMN